MPLSKREFGRLKAILDSQLFPELRPLLEKIQQPYGIDELNNPERNLYNNKVAPLLGDYKCEGKDKTGCPFQKEVTEDNEWLTYIRCGKKLCQDCAPDSLSGLPLEKK